ncbi:MAG: hypothetical protein LBB91_08730 [Clostridiales bacterium]|jgi:stage III sporulation protein AB|nr:hypothetical protein [Clostridiales bacterium]
MLKFAGAILIILACGVGGRLAAVRLLRRLRLIQGLQNGLLALEREISYSSTPLPQALLQAAAAGGEGAAVFEVSARYLGTGEGLDPGQALALALAEVEDTSILTDEDRQVLGSFGLGLGLSDGEDQLKRLKMTRQRLLVLEGEAKARWEKDGKIWQSLGWAGGLLLALVLL